MNDVDHAMTRRRALGRLAEWTAAGALGPLILPARAFGGTAANSVMRLALIGCGRMGVADLRNAMAAGLKPQANARVVAVCDVDEIRANAACGDVRRFTAERKLPAADVTVHADFREILARADVDAVIVATPDHWHAAIAIAAARAGKHIYLEKPLTYGHRQGRELVRTVRAANVVLQTGMQQRSMTYFRQVCTIVRNQWLGGLKTIEIALPLDSGRADAAPMPVPPGLRYDMWLGPAPDAPYTEGRVHPQHDRHGRPGWMQVGDYCHGMITGWGTHQFDIAQWAMGLDHGPVEVRCHGEFPERGLFDVHTAFTGEARYANGVRLLTNGGEQGLRFQCENGWAACSRDGFECSDRALLRRRPAANEVKLHESQDHMLDFLIATREGRDPACPVEVGHLANTVALLHHLSMKLGGRTIKWDPAGERILGDDEAAARLDVTERGAWKT